MTISSSLSATRTSSTTSSAGYPPSPSRRPLASAGPGSASPIESSPALSSLPPSPSIHPHMYERHLLCQTRSNYSPFETNPAAAFLGFMPTCFCDCWQGALREVLDKVLSDPIRPHFAIVNVGNNCDLSRMLALVRILPWPYFIFVILKNISVRLFSNRSSC